MAREDLHFRLRIPEELKSRIEASAEQHHRSMTAEIVARLEQSFEHADSAARIERLELERKHLGNLYGVEHQHRKTAEKLNHSTAWLLHIFAGLIRQYGEGNPGPLQDFIERSKSRPEMLDFKAPEPLDADDE